MEPEGSLLHLEAPATCPYIEPDQANQCISSRVAVRVSVSTSWAIIGSSVGTPLYWFSFNMLVLVADTGYCAGGSG
jgi:hypothetical protein